MTINNSNFEIPLDKRTAEALSRLSASQINMAKQEVAEVVRFFVYSRLPNKKSKADRRASLYNTFGETTKYAKKAGITQKNIDEATL